MGKKRQRAGGSVKPTPTLSEQIERREQATLLREAQQRMQSGETLTPKHKAAVERHQQDTFLSVFLGCQKTFFAELLGAAPKVLVDNRDRRGFPWPVGKRDRVNGRDILRFLWRHFLENKPQGYTGKRTVDDILLEGASQELKDQYVREQIQEKQLQRRIKAHELELLEQAHIPTKEVRTLLGEVANLIAKKRESLERSLDGESLKIASRAFEDMADDIARKADGIDDGGDSEIESIDLA